MEFFSCIFLRLWYIKDIMSKISKVVAGGKGSVKYSRGKTKIKGLRNKRRTKLAKLREEEARKQRARKRSAQRREELLNDDPYKYYKEDRPRRRSKPQKSRKDFDFDALVSDSK